jgi:hypothetical protein
MSRLRRVLVGLGIGAAMTVLLSGAQGPIPAQAAPKLTLAVFGDYGNCYYTCQNERAVADLVHSWSPDYLLTVGDNSYESGRDYEVQADQALYLDDIRAGRFYQATGNHDWGNTCNPGMIAPSTTLFGRPPHYTAHLGSGLLDLFALDMNCGDPDGDSANSKQAQQYRADVAASQAVWKITSDHQPFYSSGHWGTQTYTHWGILPAIDLFLSGHDHDMEHLLVGDQNFVVTGAGGKNHTLVCRPTCIAGSVFHDDTTYGANRLTITPTSLTVDFVAVGGSVLHSFTLSKTPGTAPSAQPAGTEPGGNSHLPLRAAFYYPWYPEAWKQSHLNPYTKYQPSLGDYDSSSVSVLKQHIAEMQYGQIEAGIASWWGPGSPTDTRIPLLLSAARGTGFKWALYYEAEGQGDPPPTQIASDLAYISSRYANDPAYLRLDGKLVLFAYADARDRCGMVDRWKQAGALSKAYVVMKVFTGFKSCANQPAGWHQYAPAVAEHSVAGNSFSISPGFNKASESAPRLSRDLNRWYAEIQQMVASGAPFQLITTFNEWGEGTAVEPATDWAAGGQFGAYLQALHDNGPPQDDANTSRLSTGKVSIGSVVQAVLLLLLVAAPLLGAVSVIALYRRRRLARP